MRQPVVPAHKRTFDDQIIDVRTRRSDNASTASLRGTVGRSDPQRHQHIKGVKHMTFGRLRGNEHGAFDLRAVEIAFQLQIVIGL